MRAAETSAASRLHGVLSIDEPPSRPSASPEWQLLEQVCLRAESEGPAGWATVVPRLDAYLRDSPNEVQAWIFLGKAHCAQGNERSAMQAAQEALRIDPNVQLGYGLHALVARRWAAAGEWALAVQQSEAALASRPGDTGTLEVLAHAHYAQDQQDRAEAVLGMLHKVAPDRSVRCVHIFAKDAKRADARYRWLKLAVAWGQGKERPHRELGEVCLLLRRDTEALQCFKEAFTYAPGDGDVAHKLAQLYLRSGNVEEALEVYRRAVRSAPENYPLHRAYGQLLLQEHRAAEGADVIRLAARLAPPGESAALYIKLAELQQSMGLYTEALRAWEAAVVLDENSIQAWRGLAAGAAAADNDRAQLRALRQLAAREPQNAEWPLRMGTLLSSPKVVAGGGDAPRDHFMRALQLHPEHPAALIGLARLGGAEAQGFYDRAALSARACGDTALEAAALQGRSAAGALAPSSAASGGSAVKPSEGSTDDWRDCLYEDQALEVYSKSAGKWIAGNVVQTSSDMVKLKYLIDDHWCEKVLLKTSEYLRLPCPAEEPKSGGAVPSTPPEVRPLVKEPVVPTPVVPAPAVRAPTPPAKEPVEVGPAVTAARDVLPPTKEPVEVGPAVTAARDVLPPTKAMQPAAIDPRFLNFGKVLGQGGFGAVFRGTYKDREVAIKKLHVVDGASITPTQVEEFKKEVANLQSLRHQRLVSFIGITYVEPSLCIVTEFMPNGSLYDLLHQRKQNLSPYERWNISVQISEGVQFLHSKTPPFVHRDLKSMNVVMDHELNAKLCDFGLTQSMENTHISRKEQEGGSPRYMAPELFDSRGRITEKVDIWALACLVVEVSTSRMPHKECSTIQQVMIKTLVNQELPFLDWTGVHPDLRSLAKLCFEFDPRKRADASRLLEGLRVLKPTG